MNSLKLIKTLWKTTRIPVISGLVNIFDLRNSQPAAAKSAAGFRSLEIYKDTLDAMH
ncbi:hypothetical protein [Buttiauxella sp. BIGb0552]|uniref:hypothetical protein n=1 Tax=Buttiauxella sp. BIGb0552 TaxID=2485120 RepID=UPI0014170E30|nr:hypothetical protein [Buttiauxella sp. BIGb0552]